MVIRVGGGYIVFKDFIGSEKYNKQKRNSISNLNVDKINGIS